MYTVHLHTCKPNTHKHNFLKKKIGVVEAERRRAGVLGIWISPDPGVTSSFATECLRKPRSATFSFLCLYVCVCVRMCAHPYGG